MLAVDSIRQKKKKALAKRIEQEEKRRNRKRAARRKKVKKAVEDYLKSQMDTCIATTTPTHDATVNQSQGVDKSTSVTLEIKPDVNEGVKRDE
ncbi:hypothetical protein KIN20_012860 [Parelaphostrongylus tenuis]|uniref:Uncharacterized protein n=1 Tax=Parelaphostrongylus tenuis TaxID=148309 RepID=A0AAD5MTX9_PARTN|nr:hypothetical protein KIN20_012860 [Parelaphostrongylus tenuis]